MTEVIETFLAQQQHYPTDVREIGYLVSANFNETSDQQIQWIPGNIFLVTDIVITNASTSLTTATDGELWTGALRTGQKIANILTFSGLTTNTKYLNVHNGGVTLDETDTTGIFLYFSLGTPQGVVATADIHIFGYILG